MEIVGWALYLAIFLAKIVEVSLGTLRIVLVTKGEKLIGATLGFFEVLIWVIVVSNVLDGLSDDPFKIVAYALGFALGNYIGSTIEGKLAFGNSSMMCVIDEKDECGLVKTLRENRIAVTELDGRGRDSKKKVLMMFVKRKMIKQVTDIIKECEPNAVITTSETKPVSKVYGIKK